jgi:hypothetical protein
MTCCAAGLLSANTRACDRLHLIGEHGSARFHCRWIEGQGSFPCQQEFALSLRARRSTVRHMRGDEATLTLRPRVLTVLTWPADGDQCRHRTDPVAVRKDPPNDPAPGPDAGSGFPCLRPEQRTECDVRDIDDIATTVAAGETACPVDPAQRRPGAPNRRRDPASHPGTGAVHNGWPNPARTPVRFGFAPAAHPVRGCWQLGSPSGCAVWCLVARRHSVRPAPPRLRRGCRRYRVAESESQKAWVLRVFIPRIFSGLGVSQCDKACAKFAAMHRVQGIRTCKTVRTVAFPALHNRSSVRPAPWAGARG